MKQDVNTSTCMSQYQSKPDLLFCSHFKRTQYPLLYFECFFFLPILFTGINIPSSGSTMWLAEVGYHPHDRVWKVYTDVQ